MKLMKRSGIYKASGGKVVFNPETCSAYSYSWWKFVTKIRGKVIFNDYRYSNATSGHQAKVRRLLQELGIKVDLYVKAPKGLSNMTLSEIKKTDKMTIKRIAEAKIMQRHAYKEKAGARRLNDQGLYTAEQWARMSHGASPQRIRGRV